MIAVTETPDHIKEFHEQLRDLIRTLIENLDGRNIEVVGQSELDALTEPTYLYITQGVMSRLIDGRSIRTYIEGDLVVYEPDETTLQVALEGEDTIDCKVYKETDFMKQILDSVDLMGQWIDILDGDRRLMEMLCGLYLGEEASPEVDFIYFQPGETIIQAGDESDSIYELLGGQAVASVDGTGVGYINKDEIFGESSFLTGTTRTATVKAKTVCFVQKTTTEDFEALVRARPQLMVTIAQKLAERLADTNRRAAKLGAKKTIKLRRPTTKR